MQGDAPRNARGGSGSVELEGATDVRVVLERTAAAADAAVLLVVLHPTPAAAHDVLDLAGILGGRPGVGPCDVLAEHDGGAVLGGPPVRDRFHGGVVALRSVSGRAAGRTRRERHDHQQRRRAPGTRTELRSSAVLHVRPPLVRSGAPVLPTYRRERRIIRIGQSR